MIDYKSLLGKYMDHVRESEGIDFVDKLNQPYSGSDVEFTPDEVAELKRMAKERRD